MLGPAPVPTAFQPETNPIVSEQAAAIEQVRAGLRILERSYFPKFELQGSAYARGTGAELNGGRLGLASGLAPTTQNLSSLLNEGALLQNAPRNLGALAPTVRRPVNVPSKNLPSN